MEEGVGYRMSADRWHQLASHTHKARSTIEIGDRHETATTSKYDVTTNRVTPSKERVLSQVHRNSTEICLHSVGSWT